MLTDYFLDYGLSFFASGWTQFAGGFFIAFMIRKQKCRTKYRYHQKDKHHTTNY